MLFLCHFSAPALSLLAFVDRWILSEILSATLPLVHVLSSISLHSGLLFLSSASFSASTPSARFSLSPSRT